MALIGIDVGNTNCKIAARAGGGVRFISERMPDNMVRGDDVVSPESMAKFLQDVRKRNRLRERDCALVLPTSQVYFRHVTLPRMTIGELELNLPYEFRDFIQDDPEEYVFDYAVDEIVRNDEGEIERMELFAAAVRRSLVDQYAHMLRKAGLRLRMVTPAPMAYMRLLRACYAQADALAATDAAKADGAGGVERAASSGDATGVSDDVAANADDVDGRDIVLVDIGHANVAISLFRGLKFDSSRTIDFGCDEFDNIIASLKGIDPYTAGSYKFTNFEDVLDEPECLALCDRFALEGSKVVNFYNFNNPEREIGQLCFLGGGASIAQLTQAIADAVPVPTCNISELMGPSAQGVGEAPVCALAYAALLEGEAM